MADGNARTFYVLTPKGERGPLDRVELRDLARQHEIEPDFQVRNAFGRGLGTVAEVLGQRAATPAARPAMSARATASAPRRRPPVALIVLGVALAIIAVLVIAALTGGGPPPAIPAPPAPAPATATPPPTPSAPNAPRTATAPPQHADAKPGLIAEFFQLDRDPARMPDFAQMTPVQRQIETVFDVTSQVTWPRTTLSERFGMRASGILRVTKPGHHAFFLISDDGSRLLVDGAEVVDNGGLHGADEKFGSVILQPGDHDIVLLFGQGGGGFACQLFWKPPGEERELLRAPNILHLPDQTLDR